MVNVTNSMYNVYIVHMSYESILVEGKENIIVKQTVQETALEAANWYFYENKHSIFC